MATCGGMSGDYRGSGRDDSWAPLPSATGTRADPSAGTPPRSATPRFRSVSRGAQLGAPPRLGPGLARRVLPVPQGARFDGDVTAQRGQVVVGEVAGAVLGGPPQGVRGV